MKAKKIIGIVLIVLLVVTMVGMAGAYSMFKEEIKIIQSIQKQEGDHLFYVMDYEDSYHFDEIYSQDINSDSDLAKVLAGYISHGFYKPKTQTETHIGCSTLSVKNENGNLIWGRNFDWYEGVQIVVRATPKNGYASISTCEFSNITGNTNKPEDMENKFLAVAAYYVPMDGVNEKGLCVAQLEVNEGGQVFVDTEKTNITVTMASRLLLDKAATVEEAIDLLKKYDICPSGGISSHLSITDATGKSVVVEFMNGEIVVIDTPAVTNFNIANGDISAGGESAMNRYLSLVEAHKNSNGVMSHDDVQKEMSKVAQTKGEWMTRWTMLYEYKSDNPDDLSVTYYFDCDYSNGIQIKLK